ncbi:MAG: WG repeat-containing protein [Bacteroidia bacterium]|jgi:hypothetical protein
MAQTAAGLAAVYKDQAGNYGYISSEGKILIPAQFKDAKAFSDGVALVKVKKSTGEIRYGLIDKSGNFISEPIYYTAGEFKEGLALVRVKTQTGELRYGYINKTGKFAIEPVYIYASEFSEGLAAVQFSKKVKSETDSGSVETIIAWAYIDKTGKTVIEESQISVPSKISMLGNFYNDVAAVSVFEFTETYYVNRKTLQPSIKGNNNKTQKTQASEELSLVQKGPLMYEYVNAKGNKAFSKSFTRASDFQEGLAMVEIDKKVAFIDKKGDVKFTTDFRYTDNTKAGGFKNGFFTFITAEGKYGVINRQGKLVINPEYSFIGEFN